MLKNNIVKILNKNFEYEPTESQHVLISKLSEYIIDNYTKSIFLIKGYAGTGKTSIVNSIVKTLRQFENNSVLLAPTGRAAKVLSSYTGKNAYTIHKKIYRQKSSTDGFGSFVLNFNKLSDTFFIVDEASMINEQSKEISAFGSGNLLKDLIDFVELGKNCRLILIGDTAQLPPVKLDISPALDNSILESYGYKVIEVYLTDVIRQAKNSGILNNATLIRNQIAIGNSNMPNFKLNNFSDIEQISGLDLIETIETAYNKYGIENVMVVNRSNKRANDYNSGIRNRILYREEEISQGDYLMVVKNNYFWLPENENTEFIANGDIVELLRIRNIEDLYGFRFADAKIRLIDYKDMEIDVKIILDTLNSNTASLNYDDSKKLYNTIAEDYANIKNKKKQFEKIRENPYFNALQVKFAYAVTCHKAQGGQWKAVFVDQGYLTKEMINTEYLRWLYTAFTRATEKLLASPKGRNCEANKFYDYNTVSRIQDIKYLVTNQCAEGQ